MNSFAKLFCINCKYSQIKLNLSEIQNFPNNNESTCFRRRNSKKTVQVSLILDLMA